MVQVLSLTLFALLAARLFRAPRGTWRFILAAAALILGASQLLPAGNPFRADVAGSARTLFWVGLAGLPVAGYALMLRGLRRRTGADAPAARHPVGLVRIVDDAALVAETQAALAAEAAASGAACAALSLGWRTGDGALVGRVQLRRTAETAEVAALWVAEPARGQGIGARLLEAAEVEARAMGARRMTLSLGSWQRPDFFGRAGYVTVAERPLGCGLTRRWMEKELA